MFSFSADSLDCVDFVPYLHSKGPFIYKCIFFVTLLKRLCHAGARDENPSGDFSAILARFVAAISQKFQTS